MVVVVTDSLRTVLPLASLSGPSLSAPPFKDRPSTFDGASSKVVGMVVGSFEKKNEVVGVGEASLDISSDSRSEGLTVSGLISFISFWFLANQDRAPTTEKKIISKGKNLSVFCFMRGIISLKTDIVKL